MNTCIHTQVLPKTESELANAPVEVRVDTLETPVLPVSGQGHKLECDTPTNVPKSGDSSHGKISTNLSATSRNFMANSARLRSARSELLKARKSISSGAYDTLCLQAQRSTATATAATTKSKSKSKFQQKLLDSLKSATDLNFDVNDNKTTPDAKTKGLKWAVTAITAGHRMTREARSKSTGPLSTSCEPFLTTEPTCDDVHISLLAAQARLYSHFFDDGKVSLVDESSSVLEAQI